MLKGSESLIISAVYSFNKDDLVSNVLGHPYSGNAC